MRRVALDTCEQEMSGHNCEYCYRAFNTAGGLHDVSDVSRIPSFLRSSQLGTALYLKAPQKTS